MSARCSGEPVSWLRLERYHLGEIDEAESRRVAQHLAVCPACAACLEQIVDDDTRALPSLSLSQAVGRRPVSSLLRPGAVAAGLGALAATVALVFLVRIDQREEKSVAGLQRTRVKGGVLAFSLMREDGARIDGDTGAYGEGERFKALVTCPPGGPTSFDLVVHDDGGVSFPLEPARDFRCGNDVPLPGAFRLTGHDEEEVCLAWSESGAMDRQVVSRGPNEDSPQLCKHLSGRKVER